MRVAEYSGIGVILKLKEGPTDGLFEFSWKCQIKGLPCGLLQLLSANCQGA